MMMMMRNVEFPNWLSCDSYHNYVANIFWFQKICKVSEVTLIPYNKYSVVYVCFIKVSEWFDSECGYNFMKRLKDGLKEVRVIYEDDNWWTVERSDLYTYNEHCFASCYTVKFKESDLEDISTYVKPYELIDGVKNEDKDVVLDDQCPPPTLEREGNYLCALCGESQGGMMSVCNNEDCEWFGKSLLEIAFSDKKCVDDVPPTTMPPLSWLKDETDDMPSIVIPPESWLNCGIELEDYQDEWVNISKEIKSSNDDVPPNVMPPNSWLKNDIPKFTDTNNYFCGICYETKRGLFSICWNKSCERYNKSVDDIYEENFNLNLKNVTFRKHQKAFQHEVS